MSNKLIRVALIASLAVALPGWASDNLPSSVNPAKGKWTKMRPASFAPTSASAREQCLRAANVDAQDRLTPAMCETLEAKLKGGECRKVLVADGVVFNFMNGRLNGHSGLTLDVEKSLGRTDPALLCDLGDRTFVYWFVGDKGKSCNNVGIVFVATPAPKPALTPVDGACGSNAKRYSFTETTWPSGGNFCASGEQSSPSILFPQAGNTTPWSCLPKNGGRVAKCEAPRDAEPPPPAPRAQVPPVQLRCQPVSRRYIVPSPGQYVYVPGLSVAVCRGQVAIPEIFVNVPSSVTVVIKEETYCQ